jgi:GDPmannose 4,6-dehydratase
MTKIDQRALITGISGQDGTYLTQHLLEKGTTVWGCSRSGRAPAGATVRAIDIADHSAIRELAREIRPTECYHLATYHSSSASGTMHERADEDLTFLTNVEATRNLMRVLRDECPACRLFLAGSCQMFGDVDRTPQDEQTPFRPNNLYAITKATVCELGRFYRNRGDLFCSTGILYNHESPLRGVNFVTTRIAREAVGILNGQARELVIGNLSAKVDWGFAGDYVRAMRGALQASTPEDYVIATGELHTVGDFVATAFGYLGLDWTRHVREDPSAYAPAARANYCGNAAKARDNLGWAPRVRFEGLVRMMVDHQRRIAG